MPVTHVGNQNTQQPLHRSHPGSVGNLPAHSNQLYVTFVTYTLTDGTEEVATDTINLAVLPVGATLIPQLCSVYSEDPGTTLTLDVGYAGNPDAYADAIVLSTGGKVEFASATAPTGALALEPMTTGQLYATVNSASTLTNAVVLKFVLAWVLPVA